VYYFFLFIFFLLLFHNQINFTHELGIYKTVCACGLKQTHTYAYTHLCVWPDVFNNTKGQFIQHQQTKMSTVTRLYRAPD